mgnify:CR=1 FL=1
MKFFFSNVNKAYSAKFVIYDEKTGILAQAKEYADGKDEAIAEAKKAGTDAQATIETVQEDVEALDAKVGTVEDGKTIVELIEEAKKSHIVFDEDCGELSPAMIKAFQSAVSQRNKKKA